MTTKIITLELSELQFLLIKAMGMELANEARKYLAVETSAEIGKEALKLSEQIRDL